MLPFEAANLGRASRVVLNGGLIVFPTDTVYGLGANPFDEVAVGRLFKAKGRGSNPIPVLCASERHARRLVSLSQEAIDLANEFWPGPLTIVGRQRLKLPEAIHQGTGAVGVRVPGSELCLELIGLCGGYLTGTSANRSGRPSSRSAEEACSQLGTRVDLILDGGRLGGAESTVVRFVGKRVEVLRQGRVEVSGATKRK